MMTAFYIFGALVSVFCVYGATRNYRLARSLGLTRWQNDAFWLAMLWGLLGFQHIISAATS